MHIGWYRRLERDRNLIQFYVKTKGNITDDKEQIKRRWQKHFEETLNENINTKIKQQQ